VAAERTLLFMRQDTPEAQAQRTLHDDALARIVDRWARYKGVAPDVEERELWPVFEQAYERWAETSREVVALVAEDSPAARREAIDITLGDGALKLEDARLVLADIIDVRQSRAREHAALEKRRAAGTSAFILGLVILSVVIAAATAVLLARAITGPLQDTVARLRDIAEGEGDLGKRLVVRGRDEIAQLAASFNRFADRLCDIVAAVRATAEQVAGASQELSSASQQLSTSTQEQAASLEETAASLEELTATVKQNADSARRAAELADASRGTADSGGQIVTATVSAMREIAQASQRISDIVGVIDDIAFQTNLLALNAAVEAARAGEQGRGFAVVASEVRNLAQRSAVAAKEIRALIRDSVAKIEQGAERIDTSGRTFGAIIDSVKRVADIIADISAASQEQSSGIDQLNRTVNHMDRVTQTNAAQTEELSSTAVGLAARAEELRRLVGRFSLSSAEARGPEADPTPAEDASFAAPPRLRAVG